MKTIYDDYFLTFELDSQKNLLIVTWKSTSEELTTEKLLIEGQKIVGAVFENNIKYLIGVDVEFKFAIVPEVQVQMNEAITTNFNKAYLKKFAHVQSSEFLAQIALEQYWEENKNKTYDDKYFDNLQDALAWCIQ